MNNLSIQVGTINLLHGSVHEIRTQSNISASYYILGMVYK